MAPAPAPETKDSRAEGRREFVGERRWDCSWVRER